MTGPQTIPEQIATNIVDTIEKIHHSQEESLDETIIGVLPEVGDASLNAEFTRWEYVRQGQKQHGIEYCIELSVPMPQIGFISPDDAYENPRKVCDRFTPIKQFENEMTNLLKTHTGFREKARFDEVELTDGTYTLRMGGEIMHTS